jgi:hypothetical protein
MLRERGLSTETIAPEAGTKVVRTTAAVAAAGAVACGVCCVLPFALPGAILAVSGGFLAWFGSLLPWMRAVAVVTVIGGWLWVALQTKRSSKRPATSTWFTMSAATVFLLVALAWPLIERPIIVLLRG